MQSRSTVFILSLITAAALVLVACGSDDGPSGTGETDGETSSEAVVNRAAGADDTSCPEQTSETFDGHIMSRLPVAVTLSVPRNSWICEDWSGVSTPGGIFNGTVVEPGSKHPFRLELHRNAAGNFILRVEGIEETSLNAAAIAGEAELTAITRTNWALYPRERSQTAALREKWRGSYTCYFVPLAAAPNSWGDTPVSEVFDAFAGIHQDRATMFIVEQGRVGLLFAGWAGGGDKTNLCGTPKPSGA